MHDPILEEVWRVREELIKQYGGLDGLIKHVQAMDRARARKAKQRIAKKIASNGRQRRTRPTKSKATRATKVG